MKNKLLYCSLCPCVHPSVEMVINQGTVTVLIQLLSMEVSLVVGFVKPRGFAPHPLVQVTYNYLNSVNRPFA